MSDAARPFLLVDAATLRAIEAGVRRAAQDWAKDWTAGFDPVVRAVPFEGPVANDPFLVRHGAAGSIWIRDDHQEAVGLGTVVVGAGLLPQGRYADSWIENAIGRARAARNRAIALAMTGSGGEPQGADEPVRLPASLGAPGSGAVQLTCAPLGLLAIVDGAASRRFAQARPAANARPSVSPLGPALSALKLDVEVSLGEVALDLGKLATLELGDVLRLPKRLGDPVAVLCEGKPLARAALGESGGRRSVQILSPES